MVKVFVELTWKYLTEIILFVSTWSRTITNCFQGYRLTSSEHNFTFTNRDNTSLLNKKSYLQLYKPWQYVKLMNGKWNESGFRPLLCTYRLNWARRTSWGWWDDWDDTVLQTQDSKFEPWRSEAEHATSRSRRLPTILTFTRGWGRNIFVSLKPPRPGTEPRTLAWKAAVLTTTLGPPPLMNGKAEIYRCQSFVLKFTLTTLKYLSIIMTSTNRDNTSL